MNSKEFNVQVVKDFLAEAKKALAKLEYNDYEVADTADRIISGCIDELEELVADYNLEQDEVELPESVTISASELALDTDDIYRDEDALADVIGDYLSDTYEFCHFGFAVEVVYNEFGEPSEVIVTDIQWDVDKEEELTVVRTMDELREYLDDKGWRVSECNFGGGRVGWEIGQGSPAGEDFWFSIQHDNDVEQAVKEIQQYAYDFDKNEHVEMWIEARRNHVAGVPDVETLVEDAQAIQEMLDELADGVNWCEKKTIGEIVSEAQGRCSAAETSGKLQEEKGLD